MWHAIFLFLSFLDVILTTLLLSDYGCYETNPFAAAYWVLWGSWGLVVFKLLAILLMYLAVITLSRKLRLRIVKFGSLLAFIVCIYSLLLLGSM